MDAAEPGPADLLRGGTADLDASTLPTDPSGRPGERSAPPEIPPSEALRAKLDHLMSLRDRGLLSPEELTVATARLLGL